MHQEWFIIAFALVSFVGVIFSIVMWSLRNGISPMPTSRTVKSCLLKQLPNLSNGVVYELGCGWGTLAFPLARHYARCQIIGLETSTLPFWFSKLRHVIDPMPNLQLYRRNFFQIPLHDASLVVCYLYPDAMRQLRPKFEAELKPGAWVISNTFAIPGWEAEIIAQVEDIYRTKIYLYRICTRHAQN